MTFSEILSLLNKFSDEQLNALDEQKFAESLLYIYHLK